MRALSSAQARRVTLLAGLAPILVVAAALRFAHLDLGLPYQLHPDEVVKVRSIGSMLRHGTLRPTTYRHPPLMQHLAAGGALVLRELHGGRLRPMEVQLAGRAVVALLGTATVLTAAWLGWLVRGSPPARPEAGPAVGLFAAALVAVAPLHVVTSHYLKEDVPLAFWICLAAVAGVSTARGGGRLAQLLLGAFTGAAIATKFSGVLLLPVIALILPLRRACGSSWRQASVAALRPLLGALVVVVLLDPFPLFDEQARQDLLSEQQHAVEGHDVPIEPGAWLWTYHLRRSLVPGMTLPALFLGLAGIIVLAVRRDPGGRWLACLAACWYLAHEASPLKPGPNPDRYMDPLVPLLAVAAAALLWDAVAAVARQPGVRRAATVASAAALAAVALAVAGWRSFELVRDMETDTRLIAAEWLRRHAEVGQVLATTPYGPPGAAVPGVRWVPLERYALQLRRGAGASDRRVDGIVTSSFWVDRFFLPGAGPRGSATRRLYARLERRWGPPAAVFEAASGPYGFGNPTVSVYLPPSDSEEAPAVPPAPQARPRPR